MRAAGQAGRLRISVQCAAGPDILEMMETYPGMKTRIWSSRMIMVLRGFHVNLALVEESYFSREHEWSMPSYRVQYVSGSFRVFENVSHNELRFIQNCVTEFNRERGVFPITEKMPAARVTGRLKDG